MTTWQRILNPLRWGPFSAASDSGGEPSMIARGWDEYAKRWKADRFPVLSGSRVEHLGDEWTAEDRAAAEALVQRIPSAELFLYPGTGHLFADPSSGDYDEDAAVLLKERTLAFLRRVG